MLPQPDIESLGWRRLNSVSPWQTYMIRNFRLAVFEYEVILEYYMNRIAPAKELYRGPVMSKDELKAIMARNNIPQTL